MNTKLKITVEIIVEGPTEHAAEASQKFLSRADQYIKQETSIGPWKTVAHKIGIHRLEAPEKVYEKKGDGYTCQFCSQTFPAAQWNDRGQVCPNPKCVQPYNALLEQDVKE